MEQEEGKTRKSMRRVRNGSKWMKVWRRKISVRRSDWKSLRRGDKLRVEE